MSFASRPTDDYQPVLFVSPIERWMTWEYLYDEFNATRLGRVGQVIIKSGTYNDFAIIHFLRWTNKASRELEILRKGKSFNLTYQYDNEGREQFWKVSEYKPRNVSAAPVVPLAPPILLRPVYSNRETNTRLPRHSRQPHQYHHQQYKQQYHQYLGQGQGQVSHRSSAAQNDKNLDDFCEEFSSILQIRPSTPAPAPAPAPTYLPPKEEEEEEEVVQMAIVIAPPVSHTVEIASVSPLSLDEDQEEEEERSHSYYDDVDAAPTASKTFVLDYADALPLPPKRRVKKVLIRPVPHTVQSV